MPGPKPRPPEKVRRPISVAILPYAKTLLEKEAKVNDVTLSSFAAGILEQWAAERQSRS